MRLLRSPSRRLRDYVMNLWLRREFAWYLGAGNLESRNASTALGLLWWVLNPLLLGLVYFLVFGVFFDGGRDIGYLMSGMFVFHFTNLAMTGGANSILQNQKLLVNVRFPRLILPIAALVETTIGFLASLGVLILIVLPSSNRPGLQLVLLPVALLIQLIFNLGLAALLARLAVPFRDINNVVPYLSRLWLYFSPIIWPLSAIERFSEPVADLVRVNPMADIISVYRSAILSYPIDGGSVIRAALWALGIGIIGVTAFIRFEGRMARYL